MSRGSVNNSQLTTNAGGIASLSISNQKRNLDRFNWIIFTSVLNSFMLSFSFLKQGKGQNKWILESIRHLPMVAILGVAVGKGSRLRIG